jgi:hypothetical protein
MLLGTLKGKPNNVGQRGLRGQFEQRRPKGLDLKGRLHPLVDRPKPEKRPAGLKRRRSACLIGSEAALCQSRADLRRIDGCDLWVFIYP